MSRKRPAMRMNPSSSAVPVYVGHYANYPIPLEVAEKAHELGGGYLKTHDNRTRGMRFLNAWGRAQDAMFLKIDDA